MVIVVLAVMAMAMVRERGNKKARQDEVRRVYRAHTCSQNARKDFDVGQTGSPRSAQ